MSDVLSHAKNWVAKPFGEDMSIAQWFLFIGLVVVLLMLWRIILHHIETALT
jgi:hypothetical protein